MRRILSLTLTLSVLMSVLASCDREPKDPFNASIAIMSNPVIGGEDFTFRVYSTHQFYIDSLRAGYEIPAWRGVLQTPNADGYVEFCCKNPEVEETTRETLWMQMISYKTGEYKYISTDYVAYKAFSFEYMQQPVYVQDGSDFTITVRSTQERINVRKITSEFVFDNLREGRTYTLAKEDTSRFYTGTFTASCVSVKEYAKDCRFSMTLANADGSRDEERGFTYVRNTRFSAGASVPTEVTCAGGRTVAVPLTVTSSREKLILSDFSSSLQGLKEIKFGSYRRGDLIPLDKDTDGYRGTVNVILTGDFAEGDRGTLDVRLLDSQDPRADYDKVGENFSMDFIVGKGAGPDPGKPSIDIEYNGSAEIPDPLTMDVYDAQDLVSGATAEITFTPSTGTLDGGFVISQMSGSGTDRGSVSLYVGGQKQTMPYTWTGTSGGKAEFRGETAGEVSIRIESKNDPSVFKVVTFYVRHRLALVVTGTFSREGYTTYDNWVGWYGLPDSFRMYLCEYPSVFDLKGMAQKGTVHPTGLADVSMPAYTAATVGLSADVRVVHKSYYTLDRERYYLCGNNPDAVFEGFGNKYKYLSELYDLSLATSPINIGTVTLNAANSISFGDGGSTAEDRNTLLWRLRLIDDNMRYVYKHTTIIEGLEHAPEWEFFYIDVNNVRYSDAKNVVRYIVHLYKAPSSGERPYWYNADNQPAVVKVD